MKSIFVFLALILTASAQAEMPSLVQCANPDANGKIVLHSFEFRQTTEESFPPQYEIRIFTSRLTPGENPDAPTSSDDPLPPQDIISDQTYTGSLDAKDTNLIYFALNGFIRFDDVGIMGESTMTFQLPDQDADIAQVVGNCQVPEPRGGVGN